MKRYALLSILILALAAGGASGFPTPFSSPPFQHGTLTDTKMCIYTAGVGIVCDSDPPGSGTVTEEKA